MFNIKKSLKLMTYSVGFKKQIFLLGLLLVIGVVLEILTGCSNMVGGFYIAIVGAVPGQMLLLVTVPNVVKASPYYHDITVKMAAVMNFLCELCCYTLVMIIHGVYAGVRPENADISMTVVFLVGMIISVTQILYPMMYKHYWITLILLLIVVMGMCFWMREYVYGAAGMHLPMAVYVLGGYAFTLLGMLGGILVNHLFYKHELDPMTYKSMMKKIDGSF